ncbi:hypothetical protein [Sphingomonas sp. NIC1]|uniref:hypothetical protein n=1 Tax=Sphingomonas sp. NIC1 TaxID=1961362 RepID=UPI0007C0DA9B|nr:hypothetical protein [Sphingomonas sp. NIC1]ANC86673.1 hypothetical protein A7E77_07065 [Sphingomonas sp. NIC1]
MATGPDKGYRWRARLEEAGILQGADAGDRLSVTLEDMGLHPAPRPDLGADLIRSERIEGLVEGGAFAGLLASAVGEHRWIHLATASTWYGGQAAAVALVRAIGAGRPVPTIGHRTMRGTVDEAVAGELAALGWRRIAAPALFDA